MHINVVPVPSNDGSGYMYIRIDHCFINQFFVYLSSPYLIKVKTLVLLLCRCILRFPATIEAPVRMPSFSLALKPRGREQLMKDFHVLVRRGTSLSLCLWETPKVMSFGDT